MKSVDGTAVVVEDYLKVSSALSWDAGDITERTLSISVLDDALLEGDESFSLSLVSPTGDTLGNTATLIITIDDYENGRVSFTSTDYSINEQEPQLVLGVLREQGSDGDIAVNFSSSSLSATPDSDYLERVSSIEFADGEIYKLVALDILDDAIAELAEELTIHLSEFTGGAIAGAVVNATVTIEDDDSDFTPALKRLNTSTELVTKPNSIELSQAIPSDDDTSFLTLLNQNPVLAVTELEITQASSGIATIVVGESKATFRPTTVVRSDEGDAIGIFLRSDNSGYFSTAEGIRVNFQPALAGIDVLQKALGDMSLSKIVLTEQGNVSIQKNQGPPPLLQNSAGQIYIDNNYYDRFHFRPTLFSILSDETATEVSVIDSSLDSAQFDLRITYTEGSSFWQQILKAAPIDQLELLGHLELLGGVSNIVAGSNALIQFTQHDERYALLPDVTIERVEQFDAQDVGLKVVDDINNDGQPDYRMVYSSGDAQALLLIPRKAP